MSPAPTPEYVQRTLDEHLSLSERKCVSYLPIPTIENVLGMTIEAYLAEAGRRRLRSIVAQPPDTPIKGGAVFLYSEEDLAVLLVRHRAALEAYQWPTDAEPFVARLASEWLDDGHPIKPIVREAFGDSDG